MKNPSQINGHVYNARHETSITFGNKKRDYLRDKIKELEIHNKRKICHRWRHK
jgi:hypothetical protein